MTEDPSSHPDQVLLPTRSRRRAMDWSLALLSQGLPSAIVREGHAWYLRVEADQSDRAREIIRLYENENRRWVWQSQVRETRFQFHAGALLWCLVVAFFYLWSNATGAYEAGMMSTALVRDGEWWRLFTAITLHADLAHLLANLCIGFPLLGLAMAHFGAGPALMTTWLGGLLGNVSALAVYTTDHRSLGASGMVMAALGLLSGATLRDHSFREFPVKTLLRGIFGVSLLFVFLGLNPKSDVLAHAGGFIGGILLGVGLGFVPEAQLRRPSISIVGVAVLLGMVFWTWALAFG